MLFLNFLLYTIFIVSCVALIGIVLLQEGKGGGFGEAFGGMVSETFGVRASGVTKVTAGLATTFLLSAVLIAMFHTDASSVAAPGASGTTQSTTLGDPDATPPADDTGSGDDTGSSDDSGTNGDGASADDTSGSDASGDQNGN